MVDVRTCIRRFSIHLSLFLFLSFFLTLSYSHRGALSPSIGLVHKIARITVCVMCQITHINYLRSKIYRRRKNTQTHRIREKKTLSEYGCGEKEKRRKKVNKAPATCNSFHRIGSFSGNSLLAILRAFIF